MDRAHREVWLPLIDHEHCPQNILGQIYRSLVPFVRQPDDSYVHDSDGSIRNNAPNLVDLAARAEGDEQLAESLLSSLSGTDFESEAKARSGLTSVFAVLAEVGSRDLESRYVALLSEFATKYSLRYYVDTDAALWISFPGLASTLFAQIKSSTSPQVYLHKQMIAFEHALAECLDDPREFRIATAIQKQCNLLEAIGSGHVAGADPSFSEIVDEVGTWPHDSLSEAAKTLYKFASNYPGIRHGGTESSAKRELDLRDVSAFTLTFVGMAAYLIQGIDRQVNSAIKGGINRINTLADASAPWSESSTVE
ncbi:hypothetical protein [Candidatus Poriferisodalis sp.]|uniref:hypothetical protein n=1 Tax=Candidatus Poriferisodalis sp. TaxID=3101277 RepID=UPI003B021EEC